MKTGVGGRAVGVVVAVASAMLEVAVRVTTCGVGVALAMAVSGMGFEGASALPQAVSNIKTIVTTSILQRVRMEFSRPGGVISNRPGLPIVPVKKINFQVVHPGLV